MEGFFKNIFYWIELKCSLRIFKYPCNTTMFLFSGRKNTLYFPVAGNGPPKHIAWVWSKWRDKHYSIIITFVVLLQEDDAIHMLWFCYLFLFTDHFDAESLRTVSCKMSACCQHEDRPTLSSVNTRYSNSVDYRLT